MKTACLFLPICLLVAGCLTDSEQKLPDPRPVSAFAFESATISGQTVSMVVRCMVPDPCWAFTGIDHSRTDNTITISVFARRVTNDPCPQVVWSIEAPFNVTIKNAGIYTFCFWRSDSTTLDTTLTIKWK